MGGLWNRIRHGRPPRYVEDPEIPWERPEGKVWDGIAWCWRDPRPEEIHEPVDITPAGSITQKYLATTHTTATDVGKAAAIYGPRYVLGGVDAVLGAVGDVASTVDFQVFSDALGGVASAAGEVAGAAADIIGDVIDTGSS